MIASDSRQDFNIGNTQTLSLLRCPSISLSPSWPTLAGQHEDYLVHALNQYRDGSRKDVVMAPLVASMSDATVQQLAKYFAGLEGLETSKVE